MISTTSSLLSGLGVIVASIVGVKGLRAWRHQIKGTGDHELAKRILFEIYSVRTSVGIVRSGTYPVDSHINPPKGNPAHPDSVWAQIRAVLDQRFITYRQARDRLAVAQQECHVLWGEDLSKKISVLLAMTDSAANAAILESDLMKLALTGKISDQEYADRCQGLNFMAPLAPLEDPLELEMSESIQGLEKLLRKRLI